jgi:hypothetical protein
VVVEHTIDERSRLYGEFPAEHGKAGLSGTAGAAAAASTVADTLAHYMHTCCYASKLLVALSLRFTGTAAGMSLHISPLQATPASRWRLLVLKLLSLLRAPVAPGLAFLILPLPCIALQATLVSHSRPLVLRLWLPLRAPASWVTPS